MAHVLRRWQAIHFLLVVFLLAAECRIWIPPAQADEPIRLGIFPRRSVTATNEIFSPVVDYLEKRTGYEIELDVPPDIPAFWSRLSESRYDFVHLNQYHYVRAHAEKGWQVILRNEERGNDTIRAAIWVHKDSEIKRLQDLRGRKIAFGGGKQAMVASIIPHDMLRSAGLDDQAYISMSTLQPVKALLSLYYHQSEAAGVGETVASMPRIREQIDTRRLRVLARSEPVAHLPWAVSPNLDPEKVRVLQRAMLSLNDNDEGRRLLKSAGMTGIRPASDGDYDDIRRIIRRVTGEDFSPPSLQAGGAGGDG